MVDTVIIEQQGQGAPNPGPSSDTPPDCDTCQYFEAVLDIPGGYDSARDATVAYVTLFVRFGRAATAKKMWDQLWAGFKCPPPGKDCKIPEACENVPWYIEGSASNGVDADGNVRWFLSFRLGRRIKCVKSGAGKDVEPKIPEYKAPEPEPKPKRQPTPPPSPGDISVAISKALANLLAKSRLTIKVAAGGKGAKAGLKKGGSKKPKRD